MSTDATAALLDLAAALSANTAAVRENTAAMREAPAQARSTNGQPGGSGGATATFPNYGRSKGQSIAGATMQDLDFYAAGAKRSIADPNKAQWRSKEEALLRAIDAEITRQQGGGPALSNGTVDDFGPPPPDEDIPF